MELKSEQMDTQDQIGYGVQYTQMVCSNIWKKGSLIISR